ncbi:MAG: hypothetical protein JNK04_05950, partial [Myxococcales bacterium]|nr:hypothetical protein [Myxococcales bacterium]
MTDGNPYRAPRFDATPHPAEEGPGDFAGPLKLFVWLTAIAATSYTLAMMVMMVALIGIGVCFIWALAGVVFNRGDLLRRVLYAGVLLAMIPVGSCVLYA